jgi:hypothetical protein
LISAVKDLFVLLFHHCSSDEKQHIWNTAQQFADVHGSFPLGVDVVPNTELPWNYQLNQGTKMAIDQGIPGILTMIQDL